MINGRKLSEKTIDFKYADDEYCIYQKREGGRKVCPLTYIDYKDGYSTSYACLLDGIPISVSRTKCRYKDSREEYQGKKIVKALLIR